MQMVQIVHKHYCQASFSTTKEKEENKWMGSNGKTNDQVRKNT